MALMSPKEEGYFWLYRWGEWEVVHIFEEEGDFIFLAIVDHKVEEGLVSEILQDHIWGSRCQSPPIPKVR